MIIFKKNIKSILGNKIRLSILIIAPLLFILLFAMGAYNTVFIGIVDNDQSQLSQIFINDLKKNKFYNIKLIKEENIESDVLGYELDYVILLENGFEYKVINNDDIPIKEYYFVENENVINVKSYVSSYISNLKLVSLNSNKDENTFFQIIKDYQDSNLKTKNYSDIHSKYEQTLAGIGFTVQFMIYMSIITTGIILEDRKNGTLSRIFNSPISLKRYLFENFLSFALVAILQVMVVLSVQKFIFNFYFADGFLYILLIMCTFGLVSVTLGLLIVSLIKNPIIAYLTVGILATPMVMLGGCYWPVEMMPEFLQILGKFIPTSWVMNAVREVFNGGNFLDILDNIGILLLFGITFFIGGIFRKNDFIKA